MEMGPEEGQPVFQIVWQARLRFTIPRPSEDDGEIRHGGLQHVRHRPLLVARPRQHHAVRGEGIQETFVLRPVVGHFGQQRDMLNERGRNAGRGVHLHPPAKSLDYLGRRQTSEGDTRQH